MDPLLVALIQTRSPATPQAALAHLRPLLAEAVAGGARLILTPEASNFMEKRADRKALILEDQAEDLVIQGLCQVAADAGIWVLIGSAMVRSDDPADPRAANRSILINDRGEIASAYDKLHVFDVDLPNGEHYRESTGVRPGEAAVVAPTPWGGRPTGEAHWETLLRARAIETGAFILAPAQGGSHEDGRATWGRTLVVDPWGAVVAALDHDEPGVLFAQLDLSAVTRARAAIPALKHDRAFTAPEPVR
jgi:predicted amidohydrolase